MKIPAISEIEINQHIKTGTKFQQLVWSELLKIPKGQTRSYKQLAISLGKPTAVRAVASAVAANTLFYQIPCHRVIRSNGEIGEYRWGKELKAQLLNFENINF